MVDINPRKLIGVWDEGYALDAHTLSSNYLGDDPYGNPRFDTTRSKIGELLFQLKYRNNLNALDEMMKLVIPFLDGWKEIAGVGYVIPVPSSKTRLLQPVTEIAYRIADYLKVGCSDDILIKTSSNQMKDISPEDKGKQIEGSIQKIKEARAEHNVLLVDDLYQSGTTLSECVRILRKDSMIKAIYVLTMTQTRGGR
jgi:predicted amidophosphoribosyltransferase